MPRYFIELAYKGTHYSGFQVQENANSIQAEVEKALTTFFRQPFSLTGSSRTDAGVHALQNYFHFDNDSITGDTVKIVYHLNAILPQDIVIKRLVQVKDEAHSRFDAVGREYQYYICQQKDPFLRDRSYYFPYRINLELMQEAAAVLLEYSDFSSFSKRNSQVYTFICSLYNSNWEKKEDCLVYSVSGNRFLRGMVRGLVGTMLQVGRGKLTLAQFRNIIEMKDCTKAMFDVPAEGLFLVKVNFPENVFFLS